MLVRDSRRSAQSSIVASFALLFSENLQLNQQQHSHHQKQEALSVIVQPHDESRDSTQMLSPGKLTPCSEIIDASDFRAINEPTYQTLTSVNGRLSPPGFSPNSSYATLTPLQPLPPISTMSDKFAYGHGHGKHLKTTFVKYFLKNIIFRLGSQLSLQLRQIPNNGHIASSQLLTATAINLQSKWPSLSTEKHVARL